MLTQCVILGVSSLSIPPCGVNDTSHAGCEGEHIESNPLAPNEFYMIQNIIQACHDLL